MKIAQCPLCYGPLEVREVAPCDVCGAFPTSLERFAQGRSEYNEYEVFPGLRLILCTVCALEFGNVQPSLFGLSKGARFGYGHMSLMQSIHDAKLEKDKFCPACCLRLSFLRFVESARRLHGDK